MTDICECGAPALTDDDGFVTTIWNGMYRIPVCDACWRDPENIATEVTVQVASDALAARLPHDVFYSDLHPGLKEALATHLAASLAARSTTDPDGTVHAHVVDRWNDWYAV